MASETPEAAAAAFFKEAQAYSQAVVGIGYAGTFALLSYTHECLEPWERAAAAGSLLFSLGAYVTWTVSHMIFMTLVGLGFPPRHELRPSTLAGLWISALALTIPTAVAAAFIMFRAYWRMLF